MSLRQHRLRQMLSIRELAGRADVTPATIVNIEKGRHLPPRISTVRKLSQALGVDPLLIREFVSVVRENGGASADPA